VGFAIYFFTLGRKATDGSPSAYVFIAVCVATTFALVSISPSLAVFQSVGMPAGWVLTRTRRGGIVASALVATAVGVAASVLWAMTAGAMAAAVLLGGTYMGSTALGLTAARHLAAQPRHALARMTAAFGLGQMAGPLFAGLVAEQTGSFLIPSLVAAGGLLIAAMLTWRPS